jgi:hypothetical protein
VNTLTAAVYQRLIADGTLASLLAAYPAGSATPAVFTDDRVPADAAMPYVVTSGEIANEPWDTKTSRGRQPFRDIYVYGPHRSTKTVEDAAERIVELFHRHPLNLAGWRVIRANAHGPVRLSSEDYDARIVSVRYMMEANDA